MASHPPSTTAATVGQCNQCGKPASMLCGRCNVVWYCGQECQRKYYKGHKTLCLRFSSPNITETELLPYRDPKELLHCVECRGKFGRCSCTTPIIPSKGIVFFLLPPAPPDLTFAERITRWAFFVNYHPLMSAYDATLDVAKRLRKLSRGAEVGRSVAIDLVERHKANGGADRIADFMRVPPGSVRRLFVQTTNEYADAAVENLLAGNWGCISVFEYIVLNEAFRGCQPQGFDPDAYNGFLALEDMVGTIVAAFRLAGISCGSFRLEEADRVSH